MQLVANGLWYCPTSRRHPEVYIVTGRGWRPANRSCGAGCACRGSIDASPASGWRRPTRAHTFAASARDRAHPRFVVAPIGDDALCRL